MKKFSEAKVAKRLDLLKGKMKRQLHPEKFKYPEFGRVIKEARGNRTQEWLAVQLGKKRHTVSEYEQGKRPSPDTVGALAAILKLDPDYLADLTDLDPYEVRQTYLQRAWPYTTFQELLDDAYHEIATARLLRKYGAPQQALLIADKWIRRLESRIVIEQQLSSKNNECIRELNATLLKALNERMACNTEFCASSQVVSVIQPDYMRILRLAKECGDKHEEAWAHSWYAGGYLVSHDYQRAVLHARIAVDTYSDMGLFAETYRTLLLGYGFSREKEHFLETEKLALDLVERGLLSSDTIALLEGIGLGSSPLALTSGNRMLMEAEQVYRSGVGSGDYKPVRLLQVFRSQLFTMAQSRKPDLDQAKVVARQALVLLEGHNDYQRHVKEIMSLSARLSINQWCKL